MVPLLPILGCTLEYKSPNLSRRTNEEAEGFLTNRVADRCGDHFDHRSDRNSELAPVAHGGQRSFRGWFDPYDQHLRSDVFVHVSVKRLSSFAGCYGRCNT